MYILHVYLLPSNFKDFYFRSLKKMLLDSSDKWMNVITHINLTNSELHHHRIERTTFIIKKQSLAKCLDDSI